MYSERLLEHFRNPRNAGELGSPAVTVEVDNPACGDVLRLAVRWEDGRAADVRYQARGCTAAVAAGSALTELLMTRSARECETLTIAEIEEAVGGLPQESRHAAVLCRDAVRELLRRSPDAADA